MRMPEIAVLALFLLSPAALAQGAMVDGMRGPTPITEETRPPVLGNPENMDLRRERAYAMQPPTIPHKIDNYQVDLNINACLGCHSRTRAPITQAVPVSVTHYMDREGNFLAEISPRRYFCEQCHVTQVDAKPLVANDYEDVDTIVRRVAAERGSKSTARK
jgi:cytochrome c-type protein NapB